MKRDTKSSHKSQNELNNDRSNLGNSSIGAEFGKDSGNRTIITSTSGKSEQVRNRKLNTMGKISLLNSLSNKPASIINAPLARKRSRDVYIANVNKPIFDNRIKRRQINESSMLSSDNEVSENGVDILAPSSRLLEIEDNLDMDDGNISTISDSSLKEFSFETIKCNTDKLMGKINDVTNDVSINLEHPQIKSDNSEKLKKFFDTKYNNKEIDKLLSHDIKVDSNFKNEGKLKERDENDKQHVRKLNINSESPCIVNEFFNDDRKIEEVKAKYSKKKFYPKLMNKKELIKETEKYMKIIPEILNGDLPSYFYAEAEKICNNSHRTMITDDEIISLNKNKYTGYMGSKRSAIVSNVITNEFGGLLNEKMKTNKIIRFWSTINFNLYVLTPEIISRITKNEFRLKEIDDSYDLMELTSDYGWFVADNIAIFENSKGNDISKKHDSGEAKENFKGLKENNENSVSVVSDESCEYDDDDDELLNLLI